MQDAFLHGRRNAARPDAPALTQIMGGVLACGQHGGRERSTSWLARGRRRRAPPRPLHRLARWPRRRGAVAVPDCRHPLRGLLRNHRGRAAEAARRGGREREPRCGAAGAALAAGPRRAGRRAGRAAGGGLPRDARRRGACARAASAGEAPGAVAAVRRGLLDDAGHAGLRGRAGRADGRPEPSAALGQLGVDAASHGGRRRPVLLRRMAPAASPQAGHGRARGAGASR